MKIDKKKAKIFEKSFKEGYSVREGFKAFWETMTGTAETKEQKKAQKRSEGDFKAIAEGHGVAEDDYREPQSVGLLEALDRHTMDVMSKARQFGDDFKNREQRAIMDKAHKDFYDTEWQDRPDLHAPFREKDASVRALTPKKSGIQEALMKTFETKAGAWDVGLSVDMDGPRHPGQNVTASVAIPIKGAKEGEPSFKDVYVEFDPYTGRVKNVTGDTKDSEVKQYSEILKKTLDPSTIKSIVAENEYQARISKKYIDRDKELGDEADAEATKKARTKKLNK